MTAADSRPRHGGVPDSSGVRIFPPLLYVAGVGAGAVLQWLRPWAFPGEPRPWMIAGVLCVMAAAGLAVWAVATFRRAGTTPNPTRPTTALAFDGPYTFTRNPMYLSFAILQVGTALLAGSFWPLVTLPPTLFAVQWLVIAREESYLAAKFGAPYLEFKSRVRRWL